jgi:hypothetical protein
MWRYVNLVVPSVFATGCARSDLTTCIPVPWGGCTRLVRFKQAVFRVLNFEKISVLTRIATVVQPARGIWTGSYLAHSSFDAHCTWRASVSWNQTIFFGCLVRQRWPHFPLFQSLGICWHMGWMYHKLAQKFGYWQLLNLFFGSSQMDNWLPKYVRFKFWGGGVLQN